MQKIFLVLFMLILVSTNSFSSEKFKLTEMSTETNKWKGIQTKAEFEPFDSVLTIYSPRIKSFKIKNLKVGLNNICRSYKGNTIDNGQILYVEINMYYTGEIKLNFKYINGRYTGNAFAFRGIFE